MITDIIASVVVSLVSTGFLGNYLLQRYRSQSDTKLTRIKADLDKEVRKVQNTLDRTILVHRVQFETEFTALRDMWAKLAAVRSTMGMVRPMVDMAPANETAEEKKRREFERLKAFVGDFEALVGAVDGQSPFIPADIYRELGQAIQIARSEATEVQVERQDREQGVIRDWYQRGRQHYQEFCAHATAVSDLIRARLKELTIVPTSEAE